MLALALCVCSLPATGGTLFSDLGSGGSIYSTSSQWTVAGSASPYGLSQTVANLFTVAGSGSLSVSQVDLAVGNISNTLDTFDASIWTDNAGLPGTQVTGAFWSLSTATNYGTCYSLVSATGITGVTLTGGQQYFMVLGPLSLSNASWNGWNWNNQSVSGLVVENGFSVGTNTLGAFDVLSGTSTPEPSTPLLFGAGFIGMLSAFRLKSRR
jgi:PEP-CTERM motif